MSRPLLTLISSFILCCFAGRLSARVRLIESDVGLQDKHITAITRDSRGLMWIGTRQGLCSFDGYRFLPSHNSLLRSISINRLHYDKPHDILWISSDTGLLILHCRELRIHTAGPAKSGALTASALGADGAFYAAYHSGAILRIDTGGKAHPLATLPASFTQGDFSSRIESEGRNTLLIRTELANRYHTIDLRTGKTSAVPGGRGLLNPFFIKRCGAWRAIFGEGRLFLQDTATPVRYPALSAPDYVLHNIVDVAPDASGGMYALGRPSKLYRIQPGAGNPDTIASELFTGRSFNCFYVDPQRLVWIGTNKGLLCVSEDTRLVSQLLVQNPPVSVRSLEMDESGRYYAGTYSGLFRSMDDGRSWARISSQIPNRILSLPGEYLYFAGGDSSLYRIRKSDGDVSTGFWTAPGPGRHAIGEAYTLFEKDGTLWVGSGHGLFSYHLPTKRFSEWKGNAQFPANTHINHISARTGGGLRICSNSGLFEFDASGRKLLQLNSRSRPALSTDRLLHATQDSAGKMWICTAGGGVNIMDPRTGRVVVLTNQNGLANNETYHLMWQNPSTAWISTFNGLSRYDTRTGTFINYYITDGLTTNEFNHNAFLGDTKGRVWFGTINGINRFSPDSMPANMRPATLFVSSLSKWDSRLGRHRDLQAADTATSVVLFPQDHSLSFTLGITDYSLPENNTFVYRLPGVFDEWVRLEGAQTLRLDGLAAGAYTLEIKALDGRGRPAANMLRYRIEMRAVYYKTWWFYLLLFCLTSLLIWSFFRLRLLNIKRVQRLRQQIASDLHDEVGSLLTRITMTSDNLRYTNNPEAERAAKLEKIAALSRNASSSMSDILWAIDARNDYTGNLSDRMREHAEDMLLSQETELRFDIQLSQRMSIRSELRQQLYLIFKEAVNNIAKHSRATQVYITYHHNERSFRLEVRNNGFDEGEKAGTRSQGLRNMQMRADRIGAKIAIDGSNGWFSITVDRE